MSLAAACLISSRPRVARQWRRRLILVDTSIWVDHLRFRLQPLSAAIAEGEVVMHPYVLGEIALGNVKDRGRSLATLAALPRAVKVSDEAILSLVEIARLAGSGIGYVDCHVLASAQLIDAKLWTRDRRLRLAAERLGVGEGGD